MKPHFYWHEGRHARARYFRRAGFGAAALFLLALGGVIVAIVRVTNALGVPNVAPIAVPLVVLVAVFLASMAASGMRRFGGPLWNVMDAADRVAEGDYTVRVDEGGPPPIRALVRSFNTMTARLQDADRLRRDLMADVAHELRTPLTVLQGRIEGILDGVYAADEQQLQQLLDETNVLSRLIEDLRTLALSEAGVLPLEKQELSVVELARDVAKSFSAQHSGIVVEAVRDVIANIDPVRIREVISNLLANAVRYTPADGRISIGIEESGEQVIVTVKDTGRGMTEEQIARLFDRFYKGAESRGSGLGLAIARGIVISHGGEISATSTAGAGTSIRFTLPLNTA